MSKEQKHLLITMLFMVLTTFCTCRGVFCIAWPFLMLITLKMAFNGIVGSVERLLGCEKDKEKHEA